MTTKKTLLFFIASFTHSAITSDAPLGSSISEVSQGYKDGITTYWGIVDHKETGKLPCGVRHDPIGGGSYQGWIRNDHGEPEKGINKLLTLALAKSYYEQLQLIKKQQ